jgi:dTDP-4-amino-4,6-dideoxygalactose transaminase
MEPYRTLYPDAAQGLPRTVDVANKVVTLPTGKAVDPDAVGRICGLFRFLFQNRDGIRAALKRAA